MFYHLATPQGLLTDLLDTLSYPSVICDVFLSFLFWLEGRGCVRTNFSLFSLLWCNKNSLKEQVPILLSGFRVFTTLTLSTEFYH